MYRLFARTNSRDARILSIYIYWLFFYDDLFDSREGDLFFEISNSKKLTEQTIDYIAYTMGIKDDFEIPNESLRVEVLAFKRVGEGFRTLPIGQLFPVLALNCVLI